jgi:hypothetical protein
VAAVSGLLDALREGWTFQPFSFPIMFIGLGLLVLGTVMCVVGVVALAVGNVRASDALLNPAVVVLWTGLPALIFGIVGWWLVAAVIGLVALGYALRPKTQQF